MLILVFNSGFTHDKFSSSRGVLAALGSIIVYSGNSLAFYGGGDHRGVEGWRGGGKLRGGMGLQENILVPVIFLHC